MTPSTVNINVTLRPGDIVIGDGGNVEDLVGIATHFLSNAIEGVTNSRGSHCAMVFDFDIPINGAPQNELHILESTIRNGVNGVQLNPLSQRLTEGYRNAWALLLSDRIRAFLDFGAMWTFAAERLGKDKYDIPGLLEYIARHIPIIQEIPALYQPIPGTEYCSDFLAMLLRAGGLPGLRPATMSPQSIAELHIYSSCVQLVGDPASIRNFNTV